MEWKEREQLNYREACARAMELCSRSEKCSYDLSLKFREWQLSREDSARLLAFLIQEKYIDHQRYAHSFVHDKFRFNKWGKVKLAYLLRQKQLEDKYINSALLQLDPDHYLQVLSDLLVAKAKTLTKLDPLTRKGRLVAFARSHGFEPEVIAGNAVIKKCETEINW